MMKYDMNEAAAAVAANHRMGYRDALDIIRFALMTMSVLTLVVALL